MSIDWNLITAMATALVAFSAVLALIVQSRLARRTTGIEMLWKLEARFFSNPIMLENRRRAAQARLSGETPPELVQVLHVLEMVGSLLRRGILDKELVWCHFCYWVIHYWFAYMDQIAEERRNDRTIWLNLEYLSNKMIEMDAKKRCLPKKGVFPSVEETQTFLEEESVRA